MGGWVAWVVALPVAASYASDIYISDAWLKDFQQIVYAESSNANAFSSSGAAQGWQDLDAGWWLSLTPPFIFNGITYTNCYVTTKGYVVFETNLVHFSPSEAVLQANRMIAVLWEDYRTDGSVNPIEDIYVQNHVDGTTIRWQAEKWEVGNSINCSVTLFTNGTIRMCYGMGNISGGMIGVSDGTGNYVLSTMSQAGSMSNAQDIIFSPAIQSSQGLALFCEGLGPTNSLDIETCADLTQSIWTPIYRHSLGYGYGSVPYTGRYEKGLNFLHTLQFAPRPESGFEWSSNYTNESRGTFYRIRQLFPFDLESNFLTLNDGVKMYRSSAGNGPVLVFIHGGTQTSDDWLAQLGFFCTAYQVVIYDLRDFYRSDPGNPEDSPWNWYWAQTNRATIDLLELVNSMTNGPVNICGLSMGSAIAAQFAVLYSNRVSKLILASPWTDHTFPRDEQLQSLNALSDRTLVLVGSEDSWGSQEEVQWAQNQGYAAPIIVVEEADHTINTTKSDAFNALVDIFLREQ